MIESGADLPIKIVAEAPDAGPEALKGALLFWGVAVAVVIGDVIWVGFPAAIAINSRDFFPLPLFVFLCAGLLGTVQLFSGAVHSLRFWKFGSSELTTRAPRLGDKFQGVVRAHINLAPLGDFKARIRCDLHTSTRGPRGGRTSGISCLWEAIQTVPYSARSDAGIPIAFDIPGNGLASGTRNKDAGTDEQVTWALEIRAPLHGLDYYAEFALPMAGRRSVSSAADIAGTSKRAVGAASGVFAGFAPPRSQRWKWLLRFLVMFGLLITVAGTFGILGEIHAVRATGHVTAFNGSILDVAIDGSGSAPITAHVTHPGRQQWKAGMAVVLMCDDVADQTYTCDLDTGSTWWVQTAIGISVGIVPLVVALLLWRRRRWWA